jgi:hypothetical protein
MGPIEKDLQEAKGKIEASQWDWHTYEVFNIEHGVPTYVDIKCCEDTLLALLDELEEEHKTEIPQPVDADGVPWTGEEETFIGPDGFEHTAASIIYNLSFESWFIRNTVGNSEVLSHCRHVKPKRTLEEIARDIDSCSTTDIGHFLAELHAYLADDAGDKS